MEFENEPTDEQLEQLLRNVVIPPDLKSRLKQIPIQPEPASSLVNLATTPQATKEESETPWMAFVLAASLIGLGLFIAYQFWPESDLGRVPVVEIASHNQPKVESDSPMPESKEFENGLAEFLKGQEQLEASLHALEVAQMEARLAKLEQSAAVRLDQREVESMIAAMSEEYSIPLGMPEQQVKAKMAQVIERFPGTRGAEIALKFLKQENN